MYGILEGPKCWFCLHPLFCCFIVFLGGGGLVIFLFCFVPIHSFKCLLPGILNCLSE